MASLSRRGPGRGRPPKDTEWDESLGEYVRRIAPRQLPPPSPMAASSSLNSREVSKKTIRIRRGPGRGRPPKHTEWDKTLGEYVRRTQPHTHPEVVSPPSMTPTTSWNSVEMNEIIAGIGPRQGPYRRCTQSQRDSNGQYLEEIYTEHVRPPIIYTGVHILPHLPTTFIRTSNGPSLMKGLLYSKLDLRHNRAAKSKCVRNMNSASRV